MYVKRRWNCCCIFGTLKTAYFRAQARPASYLVNARGAPTGAPLAFRSFADIEGCCSGLLHHPLPLQGQRLRIKPVNADAGAGTVQKNQNPGFRSGGNGGIARILAAIRDNLWRLLAIKVLHRPGAAGFKQGGDMAVVAEAQVVLAFVDEGLGGGGLASSRGGIDQLTSISVPWVTKLIRCFIDIDPAVIPSQPITFFRFLSIPIKSDTSFVTTDYPLPIRTNGGVGFGRVAVELCDRFTGT